MSVSIATFCLKEFFSAYNLNKFVLMDISFLITKYTFNSTPFNSNCNYVLFACSLQINLKFRN